MQFLLIGSMKAKFKIPSAQRKIMYFLMTFDNLNKKKTESGVTETNTYSESGDMSSPSMPTVGKDVFAENSLRHLKKPATAKV